MENGDSSENGNGYLKSYKVDRYNFFHIFKALLNLFLKGTQVTTAKLELVEERIQRSRSRH